MTASSKHRKQIYRKYTEAMPTAAWNTRVGKVEQLA
jgi:hypothetical protein